MHPLVKSTGQFEIRPTLHSDLVAALQGVPPTKSLPEVRRLLARGVRVPVPVPRGLPSCYLTVDIEGYRPAKTLIGLLATDDTTILARRPRVDAGLLVLRRFDLPDDQPASKETALAPPTARKAYERAVEALNRRSPDYERAIPHLETAVEAHPRFAAAWDLLGDARLGTGDEGGGLQALTRAINADPTYLPPYAQMIGIVSANQNWEELAWLSDRFLEVSPDAPLGLYIGAAAALRLDDLPMLKLRTSRLEQLGEMPRWPRTQLFRGRVHESKGEFQEAANAFEALLQTEVDEDLRGLLNGKLRDWSKLQLVEPRSAKPKPERDVPPAKSARPPEPRPRGPSLVRPVPAPRL